MAKLVFSYAHEDQQYRDELEKHLTMLKRQGIIESWHDRRITVGQPLDIEIAKHFEGADIILLLVSPDFLASDYCYDREMTRSLERNAQGKAVVIPVILRPCDWLNSPLKRLKATPPDGKAISKFSNVDEAYLAVVRDVREAIERLGIPTTAHGLPAPSLPSTGPATGPRSSNLRAKREFTDRETDDFIDSTFEYIANYFESSLAELRARNPGLEVRFKRSDGGAFTAAVYVSGAKRTSCRVYLHSLGGNHRHIAFLNSDVERGTAYNDLLSVKNDGYALYLDAVMPSMSGPAKANLTQEGAAEHFWSMFVECLQ